MRIVSEAPIRSEILEKAFNKIDDALVDAINENDMSYTEILTVLTWLEQKVHTHMIKDVAKNVLGEIASSMKSCCNDDNSHYQ